MSFFLVAALNKATSTRFYTVLLGVREIIRRWLQEIIDDDNEDKSVEPIALVRCSRGGKHTYLERNCKTNNKQLNEISIFVSIQCLLQFGYREDQEDLLSLICYLIFFARTILE
jgi:hypothetical protein